MSCHAQELSQKEISSEPKSRPLVLLSTSSSSSSLSNTPETLVGVLAQSFCDCLDSSSAAASAADSDIDLDRLLQACQRFKENMHAVGQHGNARDLGQNILKVQQARNQAPEHGRKTVRALLEYEKQECDVRLDAGALRNPSAAMGLLWMRRAVAFQHRFNQFLIHQPHVPTVEASLQSYSVELEPFHSWPLQQIFKLAFRTTTPDRPRALAELWGKPTVKLNETEESIVLDQLRFLADIWQPLLDVWKSIFETLDLEDPSKA